MDTTDVAAGGIFQRLGVCAVRWPYLLIGFWIALAAVLALTLPPLPEIAAQKQMPPLPDDAPTMVTARTMSNAFHETGAGAQIMVILTNENGLTPADEATYRTLIDNLRQDTQDKMSIQDFISAPPMREILASKDNKAWNLPINMPSGVAAPETLAAYQHIYRDRQKDACGNPAHRPLCRGVVTTVDITMLSFHDMHIDRDRHRAPGAVHLVGDLPKRRHHVGAVGHHRIVLGTAQGVLAGLAEIGLPIGMQTIIFLVGVMVGAGTDYAVFLISRYHDYVRRGEDSDQAVKIALMSIGKVIAASAATVAVTFTRDGVRQVGHLLNGRSGDFNLDRGGVPGRGDAASCDPGADRATWLDQAATRTDYSFLAAYGNTRGAPAQDPSGRERDCAHHPGQLREHGALQL